MNLTFEFYVETVSESVSNGSTAETWPLDLLLLEAKYQEPVCLRISVITPSEKYTDRFLNLKPL